MLARALATAVALIALLAADASAATGDLTQKGGLAGCVSDTGAGPCVDGTALGGASGGAVSPDGQNVYVGAKTAGAVDVFDRAADGALTQKAGTAGCVSNTGSGGACVDGTALAGARGTVVSPAGDNVYVSVSDPTGGVAIFDRAADGTLTQKPGLAGCITDTGSGGACVDGTALSRPDGFQAIAISPDGATVYVADESTSAVAVFDRAPDGTLTQKAGTAACVSETGLGGLCADGRALTGAWSVVVSPDGDNVYVLTRGANSIAAFDRAADGSLTQKAGTAGCISDTGSGGECVDANALATALTLAISPDGTSLYAAATTSNAVVVIDRAADGTIAQKAGAAGCISDTGSGGTCADGTSLVSARAVAVSPDGRSVYVTSGSSVGVFARAADGGLAQRPGLQACVSNTGAGPCADGTALVNPAVVMVSPDGSSVYAAVEGSAAVAVFDRVPAPTSPTATTGAASAITPTGATLAGTVTANNAETAVVFEYGPTLAFGSITVPDAYGASASGAAASATLDGLAATTTYYYRLVAANSAGTAFGGVASFTTGPGGAPIVATGAASDVTASTATLAATVDARGLATAFAFEYGPTVSFGALSAIDAASAVAGAQSVSLPIAGLAPGTTYRYRIVATNAAGTSFGAVGSLTTAGAP